MMPSRKMLHFSGTPVLTPFARTYAVGSVEKFLMQRVAKGRFYAAKSFVIGS
jgi:hypothetical protein